MDREKLNYFRNLLLERKKVLEEYLADIEEKLSKTQQDASSDLSTQPTHPADLATDSESRESGAYFANTTVNELFKVNKALDKIESNTYGYCERCGKPISIERLEAIPYTEFCIKCGAKL